jgi:hypothetical protein
MRKWFSIISSVFLFLVILAIAGVWQFNRMLNSLQIKDFSYQLDTVNLHYIKFSELSFVHHSDSAQQKIQLHNLTVDWQWQAWLSPRLGVISVETAQLIQSGLDERKIIIAGGVEPLFSLPKSWLIR